MATNLRKPGLAPATLIDAGVGAGTPALYEAFSSAYLVLIEPVREFKTRLAELLEVREGELVEAALGPVRAETTLFVDREAPSVSSVLRRASLSPRPLEERKVPMTTLDHLCGERRWVAPFGLKLDVEGYEHRVIEGAKESLGQTQFVIAEVSVLDRFEGGHTFAGFVSLMDSQGFRLCDILDGARQASRELGYVDAMFRRR